MEQKDKEIVQLKTDLKEAQDQADDLNLGLILLREDVLDAYAAEQDLGKYGRDNDEGYAELKKQIEEMDSIGGLIRKRKRYSASTLTSGARTTRKSRMTSNEIEKQVTPVPGTPGADAYTI